jgi:hypothetical protein
MRSGQAYDEKRQMQNNVNNSATSAPAPAYRDVAEQESPAYAPHAPEKQAWVETREISTGEEKEYVKV